MTMLISSNFFVLFKVFFHRCLNVACAHIVWGPKKDRDPHGADSPMLLPTSCCDTCMCSVVEHLTIHLAIISIT